MNDQLMARGHHKDCVARLLNTCWQCRGRFGMGICEKGDQCDRKRGGYTGCHPECKIRKEWNERRSDNTGQV